jgi:sporulation protein YlmC with PRC-barrel domain
MASSEGPRILWEQLKGKKIKTNDGHYVGEIKELTQNYMRLEKGRLTKTSPGSQSI